MLIESIWDGIKTGSLACALAACIYFAAVGAITTIDQLVVDRASAGCAKGGQHGTDN